ncbi:MAG: 50S ribosomal protein L25 [Planctomycetales bacterium]|nr:50S ribosomal protein L25 [Planctomycetales bacterium]
MATIEKLQVTKRTATGRANNRRLRVTGKMPAVLYGHKEESVSLVVEADQLRAVLRHGAQLVELAGDASGQALLQHVQWDVFQQHLLHVDLLRVDAGERITVEVPIHTKGEAPGVLNGGLLEHPLHSIEIETSPAAIPEALHVNINHLEIGGDLRVSDIIDMPAGAVPQVDANEVVVACVAPMVVDEEQEAGGSVEPEVIGKADEEGGEE